MVSLVTLKTELGPSLTISKGNIYEQKVDAIINATGKQLTFTDTKILHLAGESIQKEAKEHLRKNGPLQKVSFLRTGPGKLPCSFIYHIFCPNWIDGKQGELSLVRETLNKVLFTMNKEKIKTVALSVFPKDYCSAYPLDVTVSMIWKTIYDWIQVNKKDSVIKNIQIVNEQEESLKLFMKEYENIVNPKKPVAKTEKVEKEEEEKKGVKRNFEQTEIKVDAMSISSTQPEDNMIMSSQSVDPVQSSTSNSLKNVVDSQPLFGTKKSKKVKKTYLGDSQPVFGKIEHSQMDQSQN